MSDPIDQEDQVIYQLQWPHLHCDGYDQFDDLVHKTLSAATFAALEEARWWKNGLHPTATITTDEKRRRVIVKELDDTLIRIIDIVELRLR